MDMIYTNAQHEEQGVLLEYEMDLAIGADENDFELTLAAESHCCEGGSLVYMEGTEYGGIVDALRSKTDTAEVIYTGRTWHGMLNSKVIEPDAGEDYYVVSGDANVILSTLIDRLGLSGLFSVSGAASGIAVTNYQFHRYCGGYDGICRMLAAHGAKLKIEWKDRAVHLSAVPITDNSSCELMPEDAVLDVSKTFRTVNHLICLGQGELSERTVIHLYADTAGNIGTEQVITGLDEITDVYENTTAASSEELEELGRAKFKELLKAVNIDASLDTENDTYDIGDIVGAIDEVTGASFAAEVTKKVVTVKNGVISTDLTTGAAKKSTANSSGAASGGGGSGAVDYFVLPVATDATLGAIKVGNSLRITEDGTLSVNTTNQMEQDNTLPITSAGVYTTVGNIEALLQTI